MDYKPAFILATILPDRSHVGDVKFLESHVIPWSVWIAFEEYVATNKIVFGKAKAYPKSDSAAV